MRAAVVGLAVTAAWLGLAELADHAPHVAADAFGAVGAVCALLTVALAVSSPLGRRRTRRRGLRLPPGPPWGPPRNPDRPAAAYESYTIPTGVRDRIGPWNVDSPPQDPGLSEWR
jgi:hypothetical protein